MSGPRSSLVEYSTNNQSIALIRFNPGCGTADQLFNLEVIHSLLEGSWEFAYELCASWTVSFEEGSCNNAFSVVVKHIFGKSWAADKPW